MKTFIRTSTKGAVLVCCLALTNPPGIHADPNSPSSGNITTNAEIVSTYKRMTLEQLMDQEVTSVAKQPETYAQAPAAVQVVTGEDIRRSGAESLPEALRLADNLDVAQNDAYTWSISARGFNASPGDKLLVLQDGRTIYTPLFSGVIWAMQDYLLADVDRIEAVSGPGGTLWGANAVNGVINITTKSAKDTQGLYVEAGGGNQLQDFTGVRYGGLLTTNVYYRVYGKYFNEGAEVYGDGTDAHDSWNRGQGGFRIDTDFASPNQFTLQGDAFGGNFGDVPGGEGTPLGNGNIGGGNVLGRWTHTFADDSEMSLQIYYDREHLEGPYQRFYDPTNYNVPAGTLIDDLNTADVNFQDRFRLGLRNNIIWGAGYRFTDNADQPAPLVAFEPSPLDQSLYSGFVQDEITLRDNLFFTLGSKLEHNDYTGFEYEPSVRLQWNVTDRQMLWGAVSRAIRMPSYYDRNLFQPSPGYPPFLGASNSDFQSETVIAYELGWRAQFGRDVSGSLSTFYNDYSHLRSLSYTPGTFVPLYFQNNLRGQSYGFELSGDYQVFDWWRFHGGYDLLEENIYQGSADVNNGLAQTADPKHQVFLRTALDLPGNLELDPGFRWIGTVHTDNGPTRENIPAYAEMDVRLAWHATKRLEFSVVGENLLHDRHFEGGTPGKTPPTQEEIVRSVFAKVAWSF